MSRARVGSVIYQMPSDPDLYIVVTATLMSDRVRISWPAYQGASGAAISRTDNTDGTPQAVIGNVQAGVYLYDDMFNKADRPQWGHNYTYQVNDEIPDA